MFDTPIDTYGDLVVLKLQVGLVLVAAVVLFVAPVAIYFAVLGRIKRRRAMAEVLREDDQS